MKPHPRTRARSRAESFERWKATGDERDRRAAGIGDDFPSRMQERCFAEGHRWEHIEGFGDVCYWCDVVAASDDRAPSEEEREAA